jgi:phosphoenolpyruvate carboxylase
VLANSYSRKVADVNAVRWIILPMVEDFETLTLVYKALDLKTRDLVELGAFRDSSAIELISLLEDAKRQTRVEYFIKALFRSAAASGRVVENMRVFLGISDSAVRHGHIASALAVIHALQQIDALNREGEYKIWPIVGMGSPLFRGGLNNPRLAHVETLQYSGYRTATVQSAVRYDVSYAEFIRVRETLSRLHPPRGLEIKETWVEVASRMYRDLVDVYLPNCRGRVSHPLHERKSMLETIWEDHRGGRSTSAKGHRVHCHLVFCRSAADASRCAVHRVGL